MRTYFNLSKFFSRSIFSGKMPLHPSAVQAAAFSKTAISASNHSEIAEPNDKRIFNQGIGALGTFLAFQQFLANKNSAVPELTVVVNEVKKMIGLEESCYERMLKQGHQLLEDHNVAEARAYFELIVSRLEAQHRVEGAYPVSNRLVAQAYTERALAFKDGSAVHAAQVLKDLNKAIKADPAYELPKQIKTEVELELGIVNKRSISKLNF